VGIFHGRRYQNFDDEYQSNFTSRFFHRNIIKNIPEIQANFRLDFYSDLLDPAAIFTGLSNPAYRNNIGRITHKQFPLSGQFTHS